MPKPVNVQELRGEKSRRRVMTVRGRIRTGEHPDDDLVNSEKVVRDLLKKIKEG